MDAKGQRFPPASRPLPTAGSDSKENLTGSKPAIQHFKSTGNLSHQGAAGGPQGIAKRAAFADRTNTAKQHASTYNSAKMPTKMSTKPAGAASNAMVRGQENEKKAVAPAKGAAFQRPAQRPPKGTSSILPSATNGYIMPLTGDSHLPSQSFTKPGQSKRGATIVYNDNRPATSGEASNLVGSSQGDALPRAAARQPRHHQSQPVLNPIEQSSSAVEQDRQPEDAGLGTQEYSGLLYLDAFENIPYKEQFPVQKPGSPSIGPLIPVPSLPEPESMPRNHAKVVGFHLQSQPEETLELSDYEEEDEYYEDGGYTTAHSFRSRGDNTTGGATTVMLPPKLSKKGMMEIQEAKDVVESQRTEEEMEEEAWDISMVVEYGEEIFSYMRELEMKLLPNANYMEIQTEIQWSMRSVLMDWVVQVHGRFSLLPETLFLTVNYIDRFLSYKIVSLGKLQLVGATAIFVAAKYEEINCPSVQEVVYMVDNGYTVEEILKAERFMLSMLNFELGWPGPMSFLRRISKADDYDLETRTLSKYFLEVIAMDERFVATPASYAAAGAHCLSRLVLDKGGWTPEHVYYSGYTYTQLKPLIGMVLDCCRIAARHHAAVFQKYSDKRYKRAAVYVEGQLKKGFRLPYQQVLPCAATLEECDILSAQMGMNAQPPAWKMPIPSQC